MQKTVKVLVSGAGGDVGQGVIKSLQKSNLDLEVYKICIFEDSSFLHLDDRSFIAPYASSDAYIPFLIRLMKKYKIDIFFPTVDSEIVKISENKKLLEEETGAVIFVDELAKVQICDDKYLTYQFLAKHHLPTPQTSIPNSIEEAKSFAQKTGYPFIVKKRFDNGGKTVRLIHDIEDAKIFIGDDAYIFQEYLDDREGEFTAGIYIGEDKEVKGVCIFKRELRFGSTYKARRIIDTKLEAQLIEIAQKLDLKYLNIQAMKRADELIVFEFNGRLSGSTAMVSQVFNASEMAIKELVLKESVERVENDTMFVAMRYAEEIYTDMEKIEALKIRSAAI